MLCQQQVLGAPCDWWLHSGHLLKKKLRLVLISVNRIYQRLVTNILCSFLLPVLVKDELEKLSEKLMMMAVLHFVCARNTLPPPGLVRVLSKTRFRLMRFKVGTWWRCIASTKLIGGLLVFPGSSVFPFHHSATSGDSPPKPSRYPSNLDTAPRLVFILISVFVNFNQTANTGTAMLSNPTRTFGNWYCNFSNTFSKYKNFLKSEGGLVKSWGKCRGRLRRENSRF